eukprot:COSAG02_NODE_1629_length_11581_cov_5.858735_9_plen_96_part_00
MKGGVPRSAGHSLRHAGAGKGGGGGRRTHGLTDGCRCCRAGSSNVRMATIAAVRDTTLATLPAVLRLAHATAHRRCRDVPLDRQAGRQTALPADR